MRSTPQAAGILVIVFTMAALAGCAAETPVGEATPSPTASAPSPAVPETPEPTADSSFAYPDKSDPAQIAIYLKYDGATPSGEVIAGPGILEADRPFTVEAQCEGDGASFDVVTADADQRTLVAGDFTCDDPPSGEFTYEVPYVGVVQVNLLDTDDVGRAWVRVIQP